MDDSAHQQKCVDGYRESLRLARSKRHLPILTHTPASDPTPSPSWPCTPCETENSSSSSSSSSFSYSHSHTRIPAFSPLPHSIPPTTPNSLGSPSRISRVNRVVSRRLAHKGTWVPATPSNVQGVPAYLTATDQGGGAEAGTAGIGRGQYSDGSGRRTGIAVRRAKVDTSETIWHLSE